MTADAWLTLTVIVVTLALLMTERTPPALAVLGGVVTLLALGVLSPEDALSGFSTPAPFSVAALYVVARAVEKTGAIQPFLRSTLEGVQSTRRALAPSPKPYQNLPGAGGACATSRSERTRRKKATRR